MSVLVNGMDMPKTCIECPMQFGGMCYVMPPEIDEPRVAPTPEDAVKQGRPKWCPLIKVKAPHGDLIDRDAILSFINAGHLSNPATKSWSDTEVVDMLESRPTALEAEG